MIAGPVPQPTPVTQPFWDAARRGLLHIPYCQECAVGLFPPRAYCSRCEGDLVWVAASGRATLVSYAIDHRPAPTPGFASDRLRVHALVALAEGVRMATQIIDVLPDPATLRLGMPLVVRFIPRGDVMLPVFSPVPQ